MDLNLRELQEIVRDRETCPWGGWGPDGLHPWGHKELDTTERLSNNNIGCPEENAFLTPAFQFWAVVSTW